MGPRRAKVNAIAAPIRDKAQALMPKKGVFSLAVNAHPLHSFPCSSHSSQNDSSPQGLTRNMAALPPPEGMTEDDYDAIHAAVVETVRGRWFLAEYARRNRVDEVQEMLAAIGRLETVVTSQRALPMPDSSPHQRLLTQRADEIAIRLSDIIEDLRESGADAYLCDELESQTRAIAGLSKRPASEPVIATPPAARAILAETKPALDAPKEDPRETPQEPPRQAVQERPKEPLREMPEPVPPPVPSLPRAVPLQVRGEDDPRLAALAALDRLSLSEKLAFFS